MAALRHPNICMYLGLCVMPPCLITGAACAWHACASARMHRIAFGMMHERAHVPAHHAYGLAPGGRQGERQLHAARLSMTTSPKRNADPHAPHPLAP